MLNPFYTHRPFLINELEKLKNKSTVKILEFGVGDGSSEIIHEYASNNKNFYIEAYETDISWLNEMKRKYQLENYNFTYIESWDWLFENHTFDENYDLVFIDQAPWEARIQTLNLISPKSKVSILHDYDFYNHSITNDIYATGEGTFFSKYNENYLIESNHDQLPPTAIFRNKL